MASPLPPDPYAALNVSKDATLAAIRSAYRKLVLTCHPDKVQDEALRAQKTHQFTQVQQAYEILSDEHKRRQYDDQVRSAELRAETLMTGTRGTRIVPEFAGPRGGVFENRGEWLYEERAPRRSYDSDDASPFEEPRVRRSTYDNSTSRRTSGRVQEERRKTREVEVERERERLRTTKEAQRSSHSDRRRTRDKDRRREYDDKHTERRAFVEDDSGSDSESTARYSSVRRDSYPRRTYEDSRRGDWEETPRRRSQREVTEYPDHFEVKIMGAQDYISKSKTVSVPEGSSRRPLPYRTVSAAQPPPPPPPPPTEPERRPSGGRTRGTRDSSRTRSGKSARSPEIVDAPSRYETPIRKPSVPISSSDPTNIKVPTSQRRQPVRSTTRQPPVYAQQEQRMPRMPRSETAPLIVGTSRCPDNVPAKSSKLKNSEIHDSGYSSLSGPGTPEMAYPQQSKYKAAVSDEDEDHFRGPPSTKYKVVVSDEDEDRDRHRNHRTYLVEPEDTVPKLTRRATERPAVASRVSSSATRGPPSRSQSYAYPVESHSSPRPPAFSRSETSRPSFQSRASTRGSLLGDFTEEPLQYKEPAPYKVQYESPKIRTQDIRYATDRRGSGASPRDAYPYAEIRRPGMERRGDSYQSVCS